MTSKDDSRSETDHASLAEFRHALPTLLGFSAAAASEHGVPRPQFQALLPIEGIPGHNRVTGGELAEHCGWRITVPEIED